MLPAGPKLYVGLCETDVEPHYLVVGSVLFLFLAKPASFADFAHEFEQLLQNLPESSGWLAHDVTKVVRLDKLAEKFASYNTSVGVNNGEILVRRRRRLIG